MLKTIMKSRRNTEKNDRKAYSQTEIACEVCKSTLRKCGWTKHVLMIVNVETKETFWNWQNDFYDMFESMNQLYPRTFVLNIWILKLWIFLFFFMCETHICVKFIVDMYAGAAWDWCMKLGVPRSLLLAEKRG